MVRLLVCDDVPAMRALVRVMVEPAPDIEVVAEAGNGEECVRLARALGPDVVLLDLAMPVMDGWETLRALRAGRPAIPRVVMLSSFAAERVAPEALEHGAAAYVEKGAAPDEILAAIRG